VEAWEDEGEQMDGAKNHDKPNARRSFSANTPSAPPTALGNALKVIQRWPGKAGECIPDEHGWWVPELRGASSCICIGISALYRKDWNDNGQGWKDAAPDEEKKKQKEEIEMRWEGNEKP
jgi:hypothetical protein